MIKSHLYLFLVLALLSGCKNDHSNNKTVTSEKKNIENQEDQTASDVPTFYADLDTTRQQEIQLITIENDPYRFAIEKYCLNDSLIRHDIFIDGAKEGQLKPAVQVFHNYEVRLHLEKLNSDPFTLIEKIINKDVFKDSLSIEFHQQATILNVQYKSVRSNRIYFDVVLSAPDTDWQEEFNCALFFRTKKAGQLDYWQQVAINTQK